MGRRADVLVIGAGPAGCAAAVTLALDGRTVDLIAGRRPRRRFAVGEGAPPGLDRTVDEVFGPGAFVAADHLRSLGNRTAWGTEDLFATDFMLNPFGTGWHLDRSAFDARLLELAAAAGVRVSTSRDDHPALQAEIVIDATGRAAAHGRRCGARRIASDRLVAVYTVYERTDGDDDATTTVEAVESGWWYTCPIPDGRRVVAFLTDADLLAPDLRTACALDRAARATSHVAALLPGSGPAVPMVVAADTSHLEPCASTGWLAVGDAAASFDPLSSQGILTAVVMGREAARSLDRPDAYATRYRSVTGRYETECRAIYCREHRWPTAPFWARRRAVDGERRSP